MDVEITREDAVKLLKEARGHLHWLCRGGEFATWVEDKEMPWAALKELEEATDFLQKLTEVLHKQQKGT